jgi:hypothetical protein
MCPDDTATVVYYSTQFYPRIRASRSGDRIARYGLLTRLACEYSALVLACECLPMPEARCAHVT